MTFAEKAYALVHTKWKLMSMSAALIIALLAVIVGGYKYVDWRSTKAFDVLALAKSIENGDQLKQNLEGVVEKYSGTAAAREATLMLGKMDMRQGQTENALKWFEILNDRSSSYPILKVYALFQQGRALEELGRYDEAADVYAKSARIKGNLLKWRSIYNEARCLEKLGQYTEAGTRYRSIIDAAAANDMMLKANSEERLLWLKANQNIAG